MAILNLPPIAWDFQEIYETANNSIKLGDNYSLTSFVPFSDRTSYAVTFPGITEVQYLQLFNIFKDYAGFKTFEWRPLPNLAYKTYVCENLNVVNNGLNVWTVRVEFKEIR